MAEKKRWIIVAVVAAVGVGTTIYAAVEAGTLGAGAVLLGCAAATLALSLHWLGRSLHLLVGENVATAQDVSRVEGRMRRDLLREKRLLLKAIAELELDFEMGKLSEKDYREASVNYRARVAKIFRQLDLGADYDAFVAEELHRRRRSKRGSQESTNPEQAAAATSVATTAAPPPTDGAKNCSKCSTRNDADAEFCKKCGTAIA